MTTTSTLDYRRLNRELDRVKTKVFLGRTAAFLGHLMSGMRFEWDESIPTACTNGVYVKWNPHFFLRCKEKARHFVLVHELYHPGLLHMLRMGERDPLIWNYACDLAINNMLDREVDEFGQKLYDLSEEGLGIRIWLDHSYGTKGAEEIYDELVANGTPVPMEFIADLIGSGGDGEEDVDPHVLINQVVSATHAAKLGGNKAGSIPGEIETVLRRFLKPKLPWKQLLLQFFTELEDQDYTWRRPNRRYSDMYLPSLMDDEGGLEHLIYYLDVSGSVSDNEVVRFNSEVKYIKDTFNPKKLTLVQFDTIIQDEKVFHENDSFDELVVIGRGGTSLAPVREHMLEHKPTAVVVFSDLQCPMMEPLPSGEKIPIIWVAVNNTGASVSEGKLINIRE